MPLHTSLIHLFDPPLEYPILQGGMQYVGYAEMAAAVTNAGGLGILTGLTQSSPEDLRKEIKRCRNMLDLDSNRVHFGVNLTILPALIPADYDGYARICYEEKVPLVEIAGGNPKQYIKLLHSNGVTKVLHKSATLRHAIKAKEAGVDLIEIVGYEASIAGGQPGDEVGLWVALARAIEVIHYGKGIPKSQQKTLKNFKPDPTFPIIASGATGTGRQLAAALSMGASGVTMATRFLATKEAPIKQGIKETLAYDETVDERSTTIVLSKLSNATRVFKNEISERIRELENGNDTTTASSSSSSASNEPKKKRTDIEYVDEADVKLNVSTKAENAQGRDGFLTGKVNTSGQSGSNGTGSVNSESSNSNSSPEKPKKKSDIEFSDEAHVTKTVVSPSTVNNSSTNSKSNNTKSNPSPVPVPGSASVPSDDDIPPINPQETTDIFALASGKRTKKMWQITGDANSAMWSCGQSVGLIHDIPSCRELMERMVGECEECLRRSNGYCVNNSSRAKL